MGGCERMSVDCWVFFKWFFFFFWVFCHTIWWAGALCLRTHVSVPGVLSLWELGESVGPRPVACGYTWNLLGCHRGGQGWVCAVGIQV